MKKLYQILNHENNQKIKFMECFEQIKKHKNQSNNKETTQYFDYF